MNDIKEEDGAAPTNSMGVSSPSNPDSPIAMPERGLFFGPISRISLKKKKKKKKKSLREITQ
jgi:hypothetical protein